MQVFKYIGLAVLGGLILAFSWPHIGNLEFLVFIGFVPLLLAERWISESQIKRKSFKVFLLAYLNFFVFNLTSTWWIKLASPGGMVLAEVFNSLFMATVFWLFHLSRKYINDRVAYPSLVILWLGFEYLHINWELSWIWLTLGNVFANRITWIQWYEYTGTLGGSLLILVVNILFFNVLWSSLKERKMNLLAKRSAIMVTLILVFSFSASLIIFYTYEEKVDPVEIVVVQPNIDPYKDKFKGMHEYDQIDRLIDLAEEKVTDNTELIFGPETAFPLGYWEHELDYIRGTLAVNGFLEKHPNSKFIVGLSTIKLYVKGEEMSSTARPLNDGSGNQYDFYNAVIQYEHEKDYQLYHKSRLVLGVEKMPFTASIPLVEKLSIKLGGASGSLGTEKEPVVFTSKTKDGRDISVIPAICYESIYSEYLSEFVHKGANLLGVVTNDGWWGNTPGYWQHLAYSRLRAIELRRSVARSANTGISAFINQKGEIMQSTNWWEQDSIRAELNLNDKITVYARFGDFLGRISAFFSVLLILWTLVKYVKRNDSSPSVI